MGNVSCLGGAPANATMVRRSYCQRLASSLCGAFVGVAIFLGSIVLLGWNEFNYVRNVDVLLYVRQKAIESSCDSQAGLMGEPVWVSCPATRLHDFSRDVGSLRVLFGSTPAEQSATLSGAWLEASSEIFQWTEQESCRQHKDATGNVDKVCTYSFSKAWVANAVDSSRFKCHETRAGCRTSEGRQPENIGSIPASLNKKLVANDNEVSIGSFGLNSGLTEQIGHCESFTQQLVPRAYSPEVVEGRPCATVSGVYVVWSRDVNGTKEGCRMASKTEIGDVRTKFSKAALDMGRKLSVVAEQGRNPLDPKNASLLPWDTHKRGTMEVVNWLAEGTLSLDGFLNEKDSENKATTWLLRLVGWLLMFIGMQLVAAPLSVAPEVVPFLGNLIGEIAGCALCCVNIGISVAVSLVVIGVAWLLARPLVGIAILAVAACFLGLSIWSRGRFRKSARNPQVNALLGAASLQQPGAVSALQFQVQVPPGCGPGSQLHARSPDGREVLVTVPPGVGPGGTFVAQLPAAGAM